MIPPIEGGAGSLSPVSKCEDLLKESPSTSSSHYDPSERACVRQIHFLDGVTDNKDLDTSGQVRQMASSSGSVGQEGTVLMEWGS